MIGLICPSIFKKYTGVIPKRKTISLTCSGLIVFSFIGFGLTVPPIEKEKVEIPMRKPKPAIILPSTTYDDIVSSSTESILVVSENKVESNTVETKPIQTEKSIYVPTTQTNQQYKYYLVSDVVDGDTLKVDVDGTIETLRLIGIDTPEVVDPRNPVQCFGKEASNKAKEMLTGKKVRIENDSTQCELDKYGRQLVYIYREDGLFYNKYMVEQGYSHEYTYDIPYKYQIEFKAAQKSAQENLRGLWSPDTCNGDTTSSSVDSSSDSLSSQTITNNQSIGKYYTSSFHTSKYYYPASCSPWKNLSPKYLKAFGSLEALLAAYPSRALSPQCQ